jgi:hypothetical protein
MFTVGLEGLNLIKNLMIRSRAHSCLRWKMTTFCVISGVHEHTKCIPRFVP